MNKLFVIVIFSVMAATSSAKSIFGQATVIDGDTIEIREQRIRLFGIDALESNQLCTTKRGHRYRCGSKSAAALDTYIGSQNVICTKIGMSYNRWVAECYVGDSDLAQWIVSQGWALAWAKYSRRYLQDMQKAKGLMVGAWSGTFKEPWVFRKDKRK